MSRTPSILIVDDVPDNIHIVASLLRDTGYRMDFAIDGASALEDVLETPYDLILLDVMMPQMDGFEVCRRLRENPDTSDIPVIFLTAKADQKSIVEGFNAGGVDYVTKPFNGGELLARINTHMKLKVAQDELKLAYQVFHSLSEGVLITDAKNRIIKINPAFTQITGYTEEEVLGKDPSFLRSERTDKKSYEEMNRRLSDGGCWRGEIWSRRKSGQDYPEWISVSALRGWKGRVENHVGVFSDITQRKQSEELIEHQAHHDSLTGLPNRILLKKNLDHALDETRQAGGELALLFVDLDGFKEINDKYGHDVGDRMLAETAYRLQKSMRSSDVISRAGGDEFVAILPNLHERREAQVVASKIISLLEEPYKVDDDICLISCSIGISIFPEDTEDPDLLITYADKAMYQVKRAGGAHSLFYAELDAQQSDQ